MNTIDNIIKLALFEDSGHGDVTSESILIEAFSGTGIIVAKDPVTGFRNVSIARLRVDEGNRLTAGIAPSHHLHQLMKAAQSKGRPLEVAVAIGNHPAILLASQMYVDQGHDEFDIAGGLLNEPVRLAR